MWVLGDCENLGTEEVFAYISADVACPFPEEERWVSWERGKYRFRFRFRKSFSLRLGKAGKAPETKVWLE